MKNDFSKHWQSSKQPRKQVKFSANAPVHIKRKSLAATLDKALRAKVKKRNLEVRKGDEVKIMRGKFKGKQGKIGAIDVKHAKIQVDGVQRSKAGGEKVVTWFHASKVKIIALHDTDNKRLKGVVSESKETKKEIKK